MGYEKIAAVVPIKKNEAISELEEKLQKFYLNLVPPYITLKEDCHIDKKNPEKSRYEIEGILRNKRPFEIEISKLAYNKNKGLFLEARPNRELKKLHDDLVDILNKDVDKKTLSIKKMGFKPYIIIAKPSYWLEEDKELIEWIEKSGKDFNFKQKVNSFIFLRKEDSKSDFIYGQTYYLDKLVEKMKSDLFGITYDGFDVLLGGSLKARFFRFVTRGGAAEYAIDALERMEEQNIIVIDTALKVLDEKIDKESIDEYIENIDKEIMDAYVKSDEFYKFCKLQEEDWKEKGKDPSDIVAYLINGLKRLFKGKVISALKVLNAGGKTYHEALKKVYPTKEDAKNDLLIELDSFREISSYLEEQGFNTYKIFKVSYLRILREGYDRTEKVWNDFIDRVYRKNWGEIIDNLDYERGKKWSKKLIKEIDGTNWSGLLKELNTYGTKNGTEAIWDKLIEDTDETRLGGILKELNRYRTAKKTTEIIFDKLIEELDKTRWSEFLKRLKRYKTN